MRRPSLVLVAATAAAAPAVLLPDEVRTVAPEQLSWERLGRLELAPNNSAAGDFIIASGWKRWRDEVGYPGITDPLPKHWASWDISNYLMKVWHPGAPFGSSCHGELVRLGNLGDGGKMICEPARLLAGPDCLVLSVGSNGDVSFERAVHDLQPACAIHVYDPTLTPEKAARMPSFVRFFNEPFDGSTAAKRYSGRRVNLLKIDCEGCEFDSLPPWLDQTCTEYINLELHGEVGPTSMSLADRHSPRDAEIRLRATHGLMSLLERTHTVYAAEANLVGGSQQDLEYSLQRRPTRPCPRRAAVESTAIF